MNNQVYKMTGSVAASQPFSAVSAVLTQRPQWWGQRSCVGPTTWTSVTKAALAVLGTQCPTHQQQRLMPSLPQRTFFEKDWKTAWWWVITMGGAGGAAISPHWTARLTQDVGLLSPTTMLLPT